MGTLMSNAELSLCLCLTSNCYIYVSFTELWLVISSSCTLKHHLSWMKPPLHVALTPFLRQQRIYL